MPRPRHAAKAAAAEEFHWLRKKLLPPADADFLLRALEDYTAMKKPDRLAHALRSIIDTEPKRAVIDALCTSLVTPLYHTGGNSGGCDSSGTGWARGGSGSGARGSGGACAAASRAAPRRIDRRRARHVTPRRE